MKTVRELLQGADPLSHEPHPLDGERVRIRQAVAAGISEGRSFSFPWGPAPLALWVIAAVVIVGVLGVSFHVWSQNSATLEAAVRFEVRLAEDQPVPGLRPARIDGSDRRVVYLHDATVVTNEDIEQSRVVQGDRSSEFGVEVEFTATGAQKMREATEGHIGRPMAVLVDGVVVVAPIVRSVISASAEISGRYTKAEAERIVNGIGIP